MQTDPIIVPFGKYKDQPVDCLMADSNYLSWILAQPNLVSMLQERYPTLFNIITIGAPESQDTPEHNKLQALFLTLHFQCAFVFLATKRNLLREWSDYLQRELVRNQKIHAECLKEEQDEVDRLDADFQRYSSPDATDWDKQCAPKVKTKLDQALRKLQERINQPPILEVCPQPLTKIEFECGFDVLLKYDWDFQWHKAFSIELKPSIGDDFPAVLRQMKRNRAKYLVLDRFNSSACSLDQVRAIFAPIQIFTIDEIRHIQSTIDWNLPT